MAKSNYITREGWNILDQELKFLWKEERPKVTQAVSEAAALGDRSENAEYIYGKRRLREIDRRALFDETARSVTNCRLSCASGRQSVFWGVD